ncbi:hypothetical protein HZ326_26653 [Fusarium oxysporum f. sp. albedinis]|nr:hypothetical protein HZ326_26653 [Fusarium oxysporum f. sp. albedinis]
MTSHPWVISSDSEHKFGSHGQTRAAFGRMVARHRGLSPNLTAHDPMGSVAQTISLEIDTTIHVGIVRRRQQFGLHDKL